jgi:hypothetical protein
MESTYEEQLVREVPTHLFRFEQTIFGLTISQLMMDALGLGALRYLWDTPFPLGARIALCIGVVILIILVVHIRIKYRPLVEWATIGILYWLTPPKTIWYNPALHPGHSRTEAEASFCPDYLDTPGID